MCKLPSSWPPARVEAGSEQQFLTPLPGAAAGSRGQPRAGSGLTGKFREACFCAQAHEIVNICSESDVRFSMIFQKEPQGTPSLPKGSQRGPKCAPRHPKKGQRQHQGRTKGAQKDGKNSKSHQFGVKLTIKTQKVINLELT